MHPFANLQAFLVHRIDSEPREKSCNQSFFPLSLACRILAQNVELIFLQISHVCIHAVRGARGCINCINNGEFTSSHNYQCI